MSDLILDHLWQSTLFAAFAGLLTLALRRNSARLRHHLWFAASVKFLVPFAALMTLGRLLPEAPVAPPSLFVVRQITMPFSAQPALAAPPQPAMDWAQILPLLLLALWSIGFIAITVRWLLRWSRLQRVVRQAVDCPILAPVPVKSAPSLLEPGLVGIFRPVILLPEGIDTRLSQTEMDAVLAHEICHLRRRDNLTAALHMLVEALFWFHPLVWWLGARLNAEREQACDESVLAAGQSPQIYAESILKVCQFYLHSPLDCAAGISGADLKTRMETIMQNKIALPLNAAKTFLLAGAAAAAIAAPLALGLVTAPPVFAQAGDGLPNDKRPAAAFFEMRGPARTTRDPRSEAALRRQIEGFEKHQPVTSELATAPAPVDSIAMYQKKIDGFGALKSIAFRGFEGGTDYYTVAFANAQQTVGIHLTENGKVDLLQFNAAIVRSNPNGPEPDTERTLRRFMDGLAKGQPAYDLLTPDMEKGAREHGSLTEVANELKSLGRLKTLTFERVTVEGLDQYKAVYEHGPAIWSAGPLIGGKLRDFGFDTPSGTDPRMFHSLIVRGD
jgi:beta-lactamase regulating signal transducer with metallopeptidase domain